MSAISLEPIEGKKGEYKAKFHFLNVKENTGLYMIFSDKLFRMWNELCDKTNGEDGVIAKVNAWAEEHDISGDDRRYAAEMNKEYKEILDKLCEDPKYQFYMAFDNMLKMRPVMNSEIAGDFDIEIVVE
jgi:hypothetical protein